MNCRTQLWLVFFVLCLAPLAGCGKKAPASQPIDEFLRLMNAGKNYLDQGQAARALEAYEKAVKLAPADPDVHLNLANSFLLAGRANDAARETDETLKVDPNSAAAYYVKGCAMNRAGNFSEAVKA